MSVYWWWEPSTAEPLGGGGQTVALGVATETDTAEAISRVKTRTLTQAEETDTAVAVARTKTATLAVAAETDTALPLARAKTVALGAALETDTLVALGKAKTKTIGFAEETDTAVAVAVVKSVIIGTATETDTALPVGKSKTLAVNLATETDTAVALDRIKTYALGVALETDEAIALVLPIIVALGVALETDQILYGTANRSPDYKDWALTGGAFINSDGELVLPDGAMAESPLISVAGFSSWSFSAEYLGDTLSPNVAFPGQTARLMTSLHYQSDGVTAAFNSAGFASNGNARGFTEDVWSSRTTPAPWQNPAGPSVTYIRLRLRQNDSVWTAGTLWSRRPMLVNVPTGPDPFIEPFAADGASPALVRWKRKAVTTPSETDTAVAVARTKARALGTASEVDEALHILTPIIRILGIAEETDTAFAMRLVYELFTFMPPSSGTENRYPKSRTPAGRLFPRVSGSPIHYCVMVMPDGSTVKTRRPTTAQMHEALYVYLGPRNYLLTQPERIALQNSEFADLLVPTGDFG